LIANGEGEFDKDVFIIRNNFIIKYEQLFEAYNGGKLVMVLITNEAITSKEDRYLRAQQYTVLTKGC